MSLYRYDDLFYLRYVLSYKAKTTKCVEPIRFTVETRTKYADLFRKIHEEGVMAVPHHKMAMRFNCTGMCGTLPTGEPLWVVRVAHSMQNELMNSLDHDSVLEWLTYSKEVQYHICDTQTRKTRKLCKMISVIDLEGFKMGGSDRRFFKVSYYIKFFVHELMLLEKGKSFFIFEMIINYTCTCW